MSPTFYATISIYVRLLGAAAINVIGLAIVTTTIPLFLCTSDSYMDFVLNAAATIFIVQLDDLKQEMTFVIEHQNDENGEDDKCDEDNEDDSVDLPGVCV